MENSSKKGSNTLTVIVLVLLVILAALLIFGFFFNRSKIDELTKSLQKTQEQIANVQNEAQGGRENVADTALTSAEDIASAISDVDNPTVRLALAKAYAVRLRALLTASEQEDLDTVVVYFEKNPKVLFENNPTLPAEVKTALANLKTKLTSAKSNSVATMQAVDKATYTSGEIVTVTGTIAYVGDDEILGGSIFTLTDSETGYVYYLHLNNTNSQNVQDTMLDEEVTVDIKVTSKAGDPFTFQVVSGPTIASESEETEDTEETTTTTPSPTTAP